MKTLTIALCLLLVVLPAGAQQLAAPRPNFYVPHGVREVPVDAMELESSSAEMSNADPGQRYGPPMPPRPYPMRRRSYHRGRAGYGTPPQPEASTGAVIAGVAAVVVALVVLAVGDH